MLLSVRAAACRAQRRPDGRQVGWAAANHADRAREIRGPNWDSEASPLGTAAQVIREQFIIASLH